MQKVAIYGAGQYGKTFCIALEKEVIKIDYFVDESYPEKIYLGKRVYKNIDNKNTIIYISVLKHSKEIKEKLISQGFKNIFDFTTSIMSSKFILHEASKLNHLWLVEDKDKMLNEKIYDFKKLLSDKKSENILENIIKLRSSLNPQYYFIPEGIEYFPSDVPILNNLEEIKFVDCGAYIGDTVEELMKQGKEVSFVISFEPDQANLARLNKELKKQKINFPKTSFFIYPTGVYSKNSILSFDNNEISSSSNINSHDASSKIFVLNLDETIFSNSHNYLKMDIEGSEKEAILGAKNLIQKYKPNLAICLYHKPDDLWELPILINKIEPSYDMYLRVHEDMGLSTVLYCIARR